MLQENWNSANQHLASRDSDHPPIGFITNSKLLLRTLEAMKHFVSKDESRAHLHGVHIYIPASDVFFVGTDGHKILKVKIGRINDSDYLAIPENIIMSMQGVNNVLQLLEGVDEEMEITIFPRIIRITKWLANGGNIGWDYYTDMIEGRTPDIGSVMPTSRAKYDCFHFNRAGLLGTIKEHHKALPRQGDGRCVFTIPPEGDTVTLTSMSHMDSYPAKGNTREIRIELAGYTKNTKKPMFREGEEKSPVSIAFNRRYLMNILGCMDCDEIGLRIYDNMNTESKTMIAGDSDLEILLMPMRL